MTVSVFAPAKVNLTLHITGQREDGYHTLDSLVAFGSVGDRLTIEKSETISLAVKGPEAGILPSDMNNLVMQAARLMGAECGAAMTLEKHLPVASGVGGGSTDAAATLRGLRALYGPNKLKQGIWPAGVEHDDHRLDTATLGADVAMCLRPEPVRVGGIGDQISTVGGLPQLPVLMVNPRVPVPTPKVFANLVKKENPRMQGVLPQWSGLGDFCDWLEKQRNDLQAPAMSLHREIGVVLDVLATSKDIMFARMSGSGATCFAIYPDAGRASQAAAKIRHDHPDWWLAVATIGNQLKASLPQVS